jgi:invasion protein IalB
MTKNTITTFVFAFLRIANKQRRERLRCTAFVMFCVVGALSLAAQAQNAPQSGGGGEAGAASTTAQLGVQTGLPVGIARSETMVFGNWTVSCSTPSENGKKRSCSATLQLVEAKSNQAVLTVALGLDEAGKPGGAVITPSGVQIAPGVELMIGKAAPRKYAFVSCENRCRANLPVDAAFTRDLSVAETIDVGIINLTGQKVTLQAPVKGFADAWALAGK